VKRHKLLTVAPAIGLLVLALAAGLLRSPTYTAEARLNVGRVDVQTESIPGFVDSVQSLAASYSRFIDAEGVVNPVASEIGRTPADVSGSISASPIPESPLIRLEATGDSEAGAVKLADATANSLIAYVQVLNRTNEDADRLLTDFREASLELGKARAEQRVIERDYEQSPTPANANALDEAQAEVAQLRLRADTLGRQYQESVQGLGSANVLSVVNPATVSSDDRMSVLQRLAFVALVGGLLAGAALATAVANWSKPRRR
jgi:hypothetical protein